MAKAAKLIRRAKVRNRSLLWHVRHRAAQALGLLVALYVLAWAWLVLDRPNPSVNYVVKVNSAAAAVAPEQRAWPLYREAIVRIRGRELPLDELEVSTIDGEQRMPRPGEPGWDRVVAFLDEHGELLALCRQASHRTGMGLQVGHDDGFTPEDAEALGVTSGRAPASKQEELLFRSLIGVLLPQLGPMRSLARIVVLDLRVAAAAGDGPRVLADLRSLWMMAEHVDETPFLINGLVGLSIRALTLKALGDVLRDQSAALTDEQWRDVAHTVASLPRTLPLQGERWFWDDTMQRIYGRHGHVTADGLRFLTAVSTVNGQQSSAWGSHALQSATLPIAAAAIAPRSAMQSEYDRLMAMVESRSHLPLWRMLREPSEVDRVFREEYRSLPTRVRYLPIMLLMPSLDAAYRPVWFAIAQRDALQAAIAVELFHRASGRYPEGWTEIVPGYLPAEPVDHSTELPLLMRVVDGRPVLYGRGLDDDDDGGRMSDAAVKRWPRPADAGEDTDWVLWPPVVRPAAERPEAAAP